MIRPTKLVLPLMICGLLFACGDGNSFADKAASFEGVYEVLDYTRNPDSCENGGDSILDDNSQSHFVIYSSTFFGFTLVSAMGCDTIAACKDAVENPTAMIISYSFSFDRISDAGGMSGTERSSGFSSAEDICKEPSVRYTEFTSQGDGLVELVKNTHYGEDYPADSEGYCTTDLGYEASKDSPCAERVTLTGKFVEAL